MVINIMTPEETALELINTFGDLASEVCDEVLMNVTSLPNIANHYIEVKKLIDQNKEDGETDDPGQDIAIDMGR
tara:strand:- start:13 stop:234 length:222 start_codon:yes stop_codon:yes gene_type:complete